MWREAVCVRGGKVEFELPKCNRLFYITRSRKGPVWLITDSAGQWLAQYDAFGSELLCREAENLRQMEFYGYVTNVLIDAKAGNSSSSPVTNPISVGWFTWTWKPFVIV
jgi:hypothetical protein